MARKALSSDGDWIRWGEVDPLWAVVTAEGKQKSGPSPWTDQEFYALGASDWEGHRALWNRYGLDTRGACLEIGCGAGRITSALARTFTSVEAVDVSQAMLDYARQRVADSNVRFHVTQGTTLPIANGSATAVFSTYVFQHLEASNDGIDYLREIYRAMTNGATLMAQLPLYLLPIAPNRFDHAVSGLLASAMTAREVLTRVVANVRRLGGRQVMRRTLYDVAKVRSEMTKIGFTKIEFLFVSDEIQWLFATRP